MVSGGQHELGCVEGNWKQFKGSMEEQRGKLNENDLDKIGGKRDQPAEKIQETYGIDKDEAEKQIMAEDN